MVTSEPFLFLHSLYVLKQLRGFGGWTDRLLWSLASYWVSTNQKAQLEMCRQVQRETEFVPWASHCQVTSLLATAGCSHFTRVRLWAMTSVPHSRHFTLAWAPWNLRSSCSTLPLSLYIKLLSSCICIHVLFPGGDLIDRSDFLSQKLL